MDAVKLKLFEALWIDLKDRFDLDASLSTFLDFLYSKIGLVTFQNQFSSYRTLVQQKRKDRLLAQLKIDLTNSPNGYPILLEFVQREEYRWLFEKHTDRERIQLATQLEIDKAIKFGNVPSKPKFYIERRSMMDNLKNQILNMLESSNCSKINIHGMNGIGKTNMAAACVRDPDILMEAKYKIYWVDLKNVVSLDSTLDIMYVLYHKLLMDANLSHLPKEKPTDIQLMKDRLHSLFLKREYDKAIIVLDNVRFVDAIKHFDVCNLLIISQEKFNLDERMEHVFLQDMFSVEETMAVFQLALNSPIQENDELDAIIHWCNGDPTMTILCANVMVDRQQSLLNSAKAWKKFKDDLLKPNSKLITERNRTIAFCLNNLDAMLREKYLDFAIFEPDVNITVNVLSLLWNLDESDVDDIMLQLCDKSLVVREYNQLIESYVYGVHHIFLNYLRGINNQLVIQTHTALVNAYKNKYAMYHQFKDDNYIYQYIGYHLHEARLVDDFEIYRDLKFIEAKIRATGIADVIRDFEIYYSNITRQLPEHERIVEALQDFVKRYGQNLERYPHTNIVQSALQLPADNLVRQLAMKTIDPFGLYFHWLSPRKNKYCYIQQLAIKNNLKVACFTSDSYYVLIGTETGDIQLWDQHYDRVLQEFKDHKGPITYLRAAERTFLSISQDGTVKKWRLDKHKSRRNSFALNNSNNGGNLPSPACIKQKNHQNFFGNNFNTDSCITYTLEDDSLISADFINGLLVAGSAKGKLMLWKDEELVFGKDLGSPIVSVQFSRDGSYIYMAYTSNVLVYQTSTGDFISKLCCRMNISSLHTLLSFEGVDEFIAIQECQVVKCRIKWGDATPEINREVIMRHDNSSKNMCSSMTDKYLVIGSDDKKIHMWDLQKKAIVEELNAQYGNVICIDATTNLEDNSVEILLTGYEDKSVKLWHINPGENSLLPSDTVDAYAAYWRNDTETFATAVARKNKITIVDHGLVAKEFECDDVVTTLVDFYQTFVYGLKNGEVYMHMNGSSKKIMDLKDDIVYLEALDAMLVAATPTGVLFVYRNGIPIKLQDDNNGRSSAMSPTIKKSYELHDKLIVVSDRKISYWDYDFDKVEVLFANVERYGASCMSSDKRLCVTCGNYFLILTISIEMQCTTVKNQASDQLTSCCFSEDNKYLALGTQHGDIEVWCLDNTTLHSTLKLHESPVHFLSFSPEGPILLSLAEQMAWWNVKLSASQIIPNANRRSFRSRSNSTKKPLPLSNLISTLDLNNAIMLTKRGRPGKEYLLSAIKLHGTSASHIVYSDNFKAFLSIDNVGNVYNLRLVDDYDDVDSSADTSFIAAKECDDDMW